MSKRPDFSAFLRGGHKEKPHSRAHRIIGVMVAKWVLRRRSRFDTNDVKIRRLPGIDPKWARSIVVEHLSAWESPHPGNSFGAVELGKHFPKLHEKVLKYWEGW